MYICVRVLMTFNAKSIVIALNIVCNRIHFFLDVCCCCCCCWCYFGCCYLNSVKYYYPKSVGFSFFSLLLLVLCYYCYYFRLYGWANNIYFCFWPFWFYFFLFSFLLFFRFNLKSKCVQNKCLCRWRWKGCCRFCCWFFFFENNLMLLT